MPWQESTTQNSNAGVSTYYGLPIVKQVQRAAIVILDFPPPFYQFYGNLSIVIVDTLAGTPRFVHMQLGAVWYDRQVFFLPQSIVTTGVFFKQANERKYPLQFILAAFSST